MKKIWYTAKCVFRHRDLGTGPRQLYEERLILLRAKSFTKAMKRAKREAESYAQDLDGCTFTGHIELFELYETVGDGAELFAEMRQSDLTPEDYLERYYPPVPDDCETEGRTHRFYNKGDGYSACYHCSIVRAGKLWNETV